MTDQPLIRTSDTHPKWRKASYSTAQSNCVEVAPLRNATAVRDSKRPAAPHLRIPAAGWTALATRLRQGT